MDVLRIINNDVCDIAKRVREIDKGYYIVYNLIKKRFEVHNKKSKPTLQLVLPYTQLDQRTILRIRETRIERAKELIRAMEKQNEDREKSQYKALLSDFDYKARAVAGYIGSGKQLPSYEDIW